MHLTNLKINITDLPKLTDPKPFERPDAPADSKFKYVPFWKRQPFEAPENLRVSYYLQEAGHEVPWHIDDGPLCSVNLVIRGNAPIVFEDCEYNYKCALIDVSKRHMVPVGDERLILKISMFVQYEKVRDALIFESQDISYKELLDKLSDILKVAL